MSILCDDKSKNSKPNVPIFSSVRGMKDHLFDEYATYKQIIDKIFSECSKFGFKPMSTPILEKVEVFTKQLGDTSDVVGKEMYIFQDRGGETLAMRPEGTAAIVRAFIEHRLYEKLPFKAMYSGPMFRYERPQKGRLRQLHQIGLESLGESDPWSDVECISAAYESLRSIGIEKNIQFEINTLGDSESRVNYRTALVDFFNKHRQDLSEISQNRLDTNPLRILDSKEAQDKELVRDAPKMLDYLTQEAGDFFNRVIEGLKAINVPFIINNRLVRGLDYYTHTVFEVTTSELGSQGTVLAGGRYDGMVAAMGGTKVAAFGWAAGLERLSMLYKPDDLKTKLVSILTCGEEEALCGTKLALSWRRAGLQVEVIRGGTNIGKMLSKAVKMQAKYAIIIGSTELKNNTLTMKNLELGTQVNMSQNEILELIIRDN